MILRLATILMLIATFASIGFAAPTYAQEASDPNTIDCTPKNQNDAPISSPGETRQFVRNFLLNAFTYQTLHQRLLCDPLIVGYDNNNDGVSDTTSVYRVAQNLVNLAVLLILIVIAFANILRIKLDTYAVKKAVPLLVFGVIMANLGLPIIRTIVDFSGVVTATFIGESTDQATREAFVKQLISTVYSGGAETLANTISGAGEDMNGWVKALAMVGIGVTGFVTLGSLVVPLVLGGIILIFLPAIIFFTLGLLFVARIYVLVILAAVSPIAFASLGFEPIKGMIWGRWWKEFIKWTFMAPATFFLFWLAIQFYTAVGSRMDIGTYIVTLGLLSMAIRTPLDMGGKLMSQWNDKLVKPLTNAISAPIKAGQEAAPKFFSRRISNQTLRDTALGRIPILRDRLPAMPLNLSRAGKVAMEEFEKDKAGKDASSEAVLRGKATGQFFADLGTGAFDPRKRNEYNQSRYRRATERAKVADLARTQFFNESGIDPTLTYNEIHGDATSRQRYEDTMTKWIQSGDPDKISAALVVHGISGHDLRPEEQDRTLKSLIDSNVDVSPIRLMYKRLLREKGISVVTSDDTKGKDAATVGAAQIEQMLSGLNVEQQQKTLTKILETLVTSAKQSNTNLANLAEIEKNPNYKAWAMTLLKYSRDPKFVDLRQQVNQTAVGRHSDAIGVPDVHAVFNTQQFSFNDHIDIKNLQKAIDNEGLSQEDIHRLSEQEFLDIAEISKNPMLFQQTKASLRQYVARQIELSNRDVPELEDAHVQQIVNTIVNEKIHENDDSTAPEDITAQDFVNKEVALSPESINKIVARLRPYQSAVRTLNTFRDMGAGNAEQNAENVINGTRPEPPNNRTI